MTNGIYKKYHTNHIKALKGDLSLTELEWRSNVYSTLYGKFLPLKKDAVIMDAGCGNGSIVWWLHKLGYKMSSGVDVSEEQIQEGNKNGISNLYCCDLFEYLKKNNKKIDLVIFRDVLEHFDYQNVIELLKKVINKLSTDGAILIQVPNSESPFFGRILYGDITHREAYSERSLTQIMNMVGFKEYYFFQSGPYFKTKREIKRQVAWWLVKKFYQFCLHAEIGKGNRIVTQNIICYAKKNK